MGACLKEWIFAVMIEELYVHMFPYLKSSYCAKFLFCNRLKLGYTYVHRTSSSSPFFFLIDE